MPASKRQSRDVPTAEVHDRYSGDRFTEGFDTADMIAARQLLEDLADRCEPRIAVRG